MMMTKKKSLAPASCSGPYLSHVETDREEAYFADCRDEAHHRQGTSIWTLGKPRLVVAHAG